MASSLSFTLTEEMLDRGVRVLAESGLVEYESLISRAHVAEIIVAVLDLESALDEEAVQVMRKRKKGIPAHGEVG